MTDSTLQTVEQTAEQLAPAISAVVATSNPGAAAAISLLPTAINLLNSAVALTQAGGMTQDQLVAMLNSISQSITASHAQWAAMNAAK